MNALGTLVDAKQSAWERVEDPDGSKLAELLQCWLVIEKIRCLHTCAAWYSRTRHRTVESHLFTHNTWQDDRFEQYIDIGPTWSLSRR